MSAEKKYKVIIAGGGTGGHIFPAVAIAQGLEQKLGEAVEILFVGAKGRMEMEKIPALGYDIVGLEVAGFQRGQILKNLSLPFKLFKSFFQARRVIKSFQPNIAIGVGGYASGPLLFVANLAGIPIVIQEQNSFPGITNKILSKKARKIFVAYDHMEQFFPKEKIMLTGNPIRQDINRTLPSKEEALKFFGLEAEKKTILVIGGSLGARTINQSIEPNLSVIQSAGYQLIWQTGKLYYEGVLERIAGQDMKGIVVREFLKEMDMVYAAADIIISRAGALSISELCVVAKPVVLVPSPNVSEDHQTKNALALVDKSAAMMVKDIEAKEMLIPTALSLLNNQQKMDELSAGIKLLAKTAATQNIVEGILAIARK
ncbi:MAG: undecaprenyldiphospho-muramoylpentapeptide beta-N-acetylglucosaminyltransferase [Chitinophagales bacterium]|nr:undecaprenyldiphospho-muramoylpentapeptide beta-N-acetylglucosaminyltransferase [Chitinophagales bacterium]